MQILNSLLNHRFRLPSQILDRNTGTKMVIITAPKLQINYSHQTIKSISNIQFIKYQKTTLHNNYNSSKIWKYNTIRHQQQSSS